MPFIPRLNWTQQTGTPNAVPFLEGYREIRSTLQLKILRSLGALTSASFMRATWEIKGQEFQERTRLEEESMWGM